MQLGQCISLIKQCQARSAIAVFWRQHSAVAAANEGKKKELEFELKDHSNSESPSRQFETFFRREEPQRRASLSGITAFESRVQRFWKGSPRISDTSPRERFTIISFNILATELAYKHRALYSSLSRAQLCWTIRKRKIIDGLAKYAPDIICLQEVDKFEDLEETLALRGYIGLYKRRTGEMRDGCAIFWKKTRFRLLQERSFEFSMLDMRNNVAQLCALQLIVSDAESSPTLSRCNDRMRSHCLVVGNIHVLYNPKRGDIKLGQCRAFLEQVHNMSCIWNGAPVVVGGDFNCTPSSSLYKYLATSELELANLDRTLVSGVSFNKEKPGKTLSTHKKFSEQNSIDEGKLQEEMLDTPDASIKQMVLRLEKTCDGDSAAVPASALESTETVIAGSSASRLTIKEHTDVVQDNHGWDVEGLCLATGKGNCTRVRHDLNLCSTYPDVEGFPNTRDACGEPLLTTCHDDFWGTVDYIWRNEGLKTLRVLDTLPVTSFATNKGLPIKVWGSDHLPLACELAFL